MKQSCDCIRHRGVEVRQHRRAAAISSRSPAAAEPPPEATPSSSWRRRDLVGLALWATAPFALAAPATQVELWKGPQCTCCNDWVKHLESNGFAVTTHADGNSDARTRLGMPVAFGSCHTALIGGYAVEGHVPAREIRRLLRERPPAVGLAVPGMRLGSPGMDTPQYGGRRDPYDVLLVRRDGGASTYASYK